MTDPRDYVAAKEAWEREHPGEVYTTAMHHSSGPRPRVLTDVSCPKCDQMLLIVSYPTLEQTRAAAAAGNPAAEDERRRIEGARPPEAAE